MVSNRYDVIRVAPQLLQVCRLVNLFILNIYIVPLQENYSEVHLTLAWLKRAVFKKKTVTYVALYFSRNI